jgi:hypothetical protein
LLQGLLEVGFAHAATVATAFGAGKCRPAEKRQNFNNSIPF